MLRIISERTLEIDEELTVCFIDWQEAFDRVNRTKLMQILKESGIDWRARRLVGKVEKRARKPNVESTGQKLSYVSVLSFHLNSAYFHESHTQLTTLCK
jgi:hypothetical protein